MKRNLLRCFKLFVASCVAFTSLEGLCSAYAWLTYGTLDVAKLNAADQGNSFLTDEREGWLATLIPDPYLGNRHNAKATMVNNVGLRGRDFPFVKDPTKYTVLLLGGSVATQLGMSGELETALDMIDGKPVCVLNGAGGGYHQPQQAIVALMYGELADAFIILDGYNERICFTAGNRSRIEYDGGNFPQVNPLVDGGAARLGAAWQTNKLRQFSLAHNSRAVYLSCKAIRSRIEASVEPLPANAVYALPATWTDEECWAFNVGQYLKYVASIEALAAMRAKRVVHFVQPVPAIGKVLTDYERRVVGSLDYAGMYQRLVDELVASGAVSLVDCFDGTAETIYADAIHCKRPGPGYRIMAERIAPEVRRIACGP